MNYLLQSIVSLFETVYTLIGDSLQTSGKVATVRKTQIDKKGGSVTGTGARYIANSVRAGGF